MTLAPTLSYITTLAEVDPEFAEIIERTRDQALFAPGDLDPKTRMLIAFAMAVLRDHHEGIKVFGQRARDAGATNRELAGVIRILYSMAGMQNVASGVGGLGLD